LSLARRAKYGGVSVSELKRTKELEAENAKLKRMYAELALENAAIKDLLSRNVWSTLLLQGQSASDGRQFALMHPASRGRDVVTPRPR